MATLGSTAFAQPQSYNWEQIRDRFQTSNPTLRAAQISIDESRAQEITAYLRPNPDLTGTLDQMNLFSTQPPPNGGPSIYSPFAYALPSASISYLHERQHKRELRRESAQKGTEITVSQYADQERTLLFNLRTAFVQTLQQKAILDLTRENLAYYNHLLQVSNDRLKAGDIAQSGFRAAGTAARAVRNGRADRPGESANGEDPVVDAAERSDAGGAVRRLREPSIFRIEVRPLEELRQHGAWTTGRT